MRGVRRRLKSLLRFVGKGKVGIAEGRYGDPVGFARFKDRGFGFVLAVVDGGDGVELSLCRQQIEGFVYRAVMAHHLLLYRLLGPFGRHRHMPDVLHVIGHVARRQHNLGAVNAYLGVLGFDAEFDLTCKDILICGRGAVNTQMLFFSLEGPMGNERMPVFQGKSRKKGENNGGSGIAYPDDIC